jgi:hypothetical protein
MAERRALCTFRGNPKRKGAAQLTLRVDPDQALAEIDRRDNQMTVRRRDSEKAGRWGCVRGFRFAVRNGNWEAAFDSRDCEK